MKTLSAFPTDPTSHNEFDTGMTLRDYFAAKAMQGIISMGGWGGGQDYFYEQAQGAYRFADAMLKAREQK